MTIDRLGSVDPLSRLNKTAKVQKTETHAEGDSISVSDEARLRAEYLQAEAAIRETPDIREDRVSEVRRRLEDPNYINDTVVSAVADEILDQFGL